MCRVCTSRAMGPACFRTTCLTGFKRGRGWRVAGGHLNVNVVFAFECASRPAKKTNCLFVLIEFDRISTSVLFV